MSRSKAWKAAERRVATSFGTMRRPLSGAWGPGGRDDVIHKRLFIEVKHYSKSAVWSLYTKTRVKALHEGKVPMLALSKFQGRGQDSGFLVCFHRSDTTDVIIEMLEHLPSIDLLKIKKTANDILIDRPPSLPPKRVFRPIGK